MMIQKRRIRPLHYLFLIITTLANCTGNDYQVIYSNRSQIPVLEPSEIQSLYADSLMVFFEQGFNETLIEITNDHNVVCSEKITTSQEIQLATVKNIGSNKDVKEFSISINKGKSIPIKITDTFKYVAVSYFKDTVYVDYMKFYPKYE